MLAHAHARARSAQAAESAHLALKLPPREVDFTNLPPFEEITYGTHFNSVPTRNINHQFYTQPAAVTRLKCNAKADQGKPRQTKAFS